MEVGKCPAMHGGLTSTNEAVMDWWPNALNPDILSQDDTKIKPFGESFNYAEEFEKLDLEAIKNDIKALVTDWKDWWPADYGIMQVCLYVKCGTWWQATVQWMVQMD